MSADLPTGDAEPVELAAGHDATLTSREVGDGVGARVVDGGDVSAVVSYGCGHGARVDAPTLVAQARLRCLWINLLPMGHVDS
ncbi:hypothetical protein CFH99_14595 [Nocardioides aromaticivorans]|uniref:Uncharacterized protein n=1 Tax=Nocardioides aromaticivorans TaxID=200618 RepID=A0ABX7PLJ8_9ACTN|nr:hypothetical protein CFH99_14595 [Nocardioides aromaticivorans]